VEELLEARITSLHLAPCQTVREDERRTLKIEKLERSSSLIGFERHVRADENLNLRCVTKRTHMALETDSDSATTDDESESGEESARRQVVQTTIGIDAHDLAVALSSRDITSIGAFCLGMERAQAEQTQHWKAKLPVADPVGAGKQSAHEYRVHRTAAIKKEFALLDTDCSGHLDSNELRAFLTDVLAHAGATASDEGSKGRAASSVLTPAEITTFVEFFLHFLDADGDGNLTADEFSAALPRRPLEHFVDLTVTECTYNCVEWSEEPEGFALPDGTLTDNYVYYPSGAQELKFWQHYLEQAGVQPDTLCGQSPMLVQMKLVRAFAGYADLKWLTKRWAEDILPQLTTVEQHSSSWQLEGYESAGGLPEIDFTQEVARLLKFWEIYEGTFNFPRNELGPYADHPELVQRRMVRKFGSYSYAKYCWEQFVAPQQEDDPAPWAFSGGDWRFRMGVPARAKLNLALPNEFSANIVLRGVYVRIKDPMLSHSDTRLQVGLDDIVLFYKASERLVVGEYAAHHQESMTVHMSEMDRTSTQNMYLDLTVFAESHNPSCGNREPIIEHWSPSLHYTVNEEGTHITLHDDQVLMLNLTANAMPLFFSLQDMLAPVTDPATHFSCQFSGELHDHARDEQQVRQVSDGAICVVENATGHAVHCCVRKLAQQRNQFKYKSARGSTAASHWKKLDTESGPDPEFAELQKPNSGTALLQRHTKDKWIREAFASGQNVTDVLLAFGPTDGTRSEAAAQVAQLADLLRAAKSESSSFERESFGDSESAEPICKVDFLHARDIYNEMTGRKLLVRLDEGLGFYTEVHIPLDCLESGSKFAFPLNTRGSHSEGHAESLLIAEATITREGETKLRLCSGIAVENGTKTPMEVEIVCRENYSDHPSWAKTDVATDAMSEHQRRMMPGAGDHAFRHTGLTQKDYATDPDSWVYRMKDKQRIRPASSGGAAAGASASPSSRKSTSSSNESSRKQPLPDMVPPGWESHCWHVVNAEGTISEAGWEGLHAFPAAGDSSSPTQSRSPPLARSPSFARLMTRHALAVKALLAKPGEEKVRQRRWARLCTPAQRTSRRAEEVVLAKTLLPGDRMNGRQSLHAL